MKSIQVIIKGRVQGVFFRESTRQEAVNLGLTGWVRNLPDGSVEAVISGDSDTVDQMVALLHKGPPASIVQEVNVEQIEIEETFSTFDIRF